MNVARTAGAPFLARSLREKWGFSTERQPKGPRPRSRVAQSLPNQSAAHFPREPRRRRISPRPPANPAPSAAPAPAQNHSHSPPVPPAPAAPTAPVAPDAGESSHRRQTAAPHRHPRPIPACPSARRSFYPPEKVPAPSENIPAREWQPRACNELVREVSNQTTEQRIGAENSRSRARSRQHCPFPPHPSAGIMSRA